MKTKTKRWLVGILAVLVAGFAVLNILACNHARTMMRFSTGGIRTRAPEALGLADKMRVFLLGINVPRPVSDRPPSDLDPECRRLSIKGRDGVTLGAWSCDRGPETPLVILFHGYAAEKTGLLPEARILLDLGASVLLVDFRGSGESSESYTTIGFKEADDVAAAVQYAHDNLPHSATILFGQSMGAAAILRAIHDKGVAPDAVILEAVFDTMLHTVRNRFKAVGAPSFPSAELLTFWGGMQVGYNGFALNPVDYAKAVSCPALFMHGADDPRATLVEGLRVYGAVPSTKEFKEFRAVGHQSYASRFPKEWRDAVAPFLETAEKDRPQR